MHEIMPRKPMFAQPFFSRRKSREAKEEGKAPLPLRRQNASS